jgi:peptidoglycan/xylan/chitin deacetylase (PgdA/CDA1 family)
LRKEIFESKAKLEDLLGDTVDAFSYPWGQVNPLARATVSEAGYKCAVTTVSRRSTRNDDPFLIPRLTVSEQDTAVSLAAKLWTGINYSNVTPSRVLQWYMRRRSAAARG